MNNSTLVFFVALVLLLAATRAGMFLRRRQDAGENLHSDLGVITSSSLAILGLIIGFSFSMAISRYDQRKDLEQAEANAIGTEYLRAELLPVGDADRIKPLLLQYIDLRISFYTAPSLELAHQQLDKPTDQVEEKLWSVIRAAAASTPTPITSLAVAGMNDVFSSQDSTLAGRYNRIPLAAWALLATIALCSAMLVGYGANRPSSKLFLVLPLLISISCFLIADIESPRGGIIRIYPQSLQRLSQTLRGQ
ncbi:hypothetical protein [Granulicella sp. WH15]|uniref:bestrophin-like domain n=1 Tax=Granulicella sp. WH15 TaxID=2602070 RepID=UPI001C708E74|nr:hypothetical protein [Granulicella sp. WH15]